MFRTLASLGLLSALLAAPTAAQSVSSRAAETIRVGGRLHTQYAASSVDLADNDFFFRRARVILDVTVNDLVSARVQPDFAGGKAVLQDAYLTLAFSDALEVSMGQFKRAFDLFDLSSSTDLSLIERDGRVAGAGSCAGVGGVCTPTRLTDKLEFAGRDTGLRVEGGAGALGYEVTVTNGSGANTPDENDAKSVAGRLTFAAAEGLRLGGAVGVHDYLLPDEEVGYATAFTADVEYGTWRDGLHAQVAVTRGDNWKVLDASEAEATFTTFQAWASYYVPVAGPGLVGVEPVGRVAWADPDGDGQDDAALLFTPGLMFYVGGKNKIGVNVDVYAPDTGDTEYSLKVQSFLYF